MFSLNFTNGVLWIGVLASLCAITYGRPQGAVSREDYTYIEKYNSDYKFHSEKLSWGESKAKCESEGATLYYPESEAEVRDVTALLNVWNETTDMYVGISDLEVLGFFKTIDGRHINEVYHKWLTNEPYSGNNKYRCVILWDDLALQVHYCDDSSYRRSFVCKTPKFATPRVQESSSPQNTPTGGLQVTFPREDYTYVEKYDSYYKLQSDKLSWGESKAKCESEGATLYYPESEAEARDVTALLHVWSANVDWINVGISDLEQLGVYKTIDGRRVTEVYNKWQPLEPDSGPNNVYRCVNLWDNFLLQVHYCDSRRAFICKTSKVVENNTTTEVSTPPNEHDGTLSHEDYTYVEKFNNYYKFHNEELSWGGSKAKCESEGATLYYPESEAEARHVTALLHVWSTNVDWINVGISDLEQLGVYKTIDGRPVSEVYNKWKPNEPDSGPDNVYRCVNLWHDFLLQVHVCDSPGFYRAFICKKPKVVENNSDTTTEVVNNDKCEGPCGEGDAGTDSSSMFFGRTVGEELRRLPAAARLRAMVGIARVLKEASPETSCHTPAFTNG